MAKERKNVLFEQRRRSKGKKVLLVEKKILVGEEEEREMIELKGVLVGSTEERWLKKALIDQREEIDYSARKRKMRKRKRSFD